MNSDSGSDSEGFTEPKKAVPIPDHTFIYEGYYQERACNTFLQLQELAKGLGFLLLDRKYALKSFLELSIPKL